MQSTMKVCEEFFYAEWSSFEDWLNQRQCENPTQCFTDLELEVDQTSRSPTFVKPTKNTIFSGLESFCSEWLVESFFLRSWCWRDVLVGVRDVSDIRSDLKFKWFPLSVLGELEGIILLFGQPIWFLRRKTMMCLLLQNGLIVLFAYHHLILISCEHKQFVHRRKE